MEVKTTEWRPGPTVCRCCLAEGCYKDISTEYFWMGKREVYADMLSETLDVTIAYSQSGGPNSNSRLICEACISRLRDASEFKRQVLECEKTFMQHLDPGSSAIPDLEVNVEPLDKEVKLERVKLEKRLSDDDMDDHMDFGVDDDDDLDDQPLTKLASKVPKKESVDLLDLLDNAKVAEKRKSTAKTKASPAKKAKTKKETSKPTASKAKPEKKKKAAGHYDPVRRNAEVIIKYTTAYPFRVNVKSLLCVYCGDLHEDPRLFRQHMDDEHRTFSLGMAFVKLPKTEFVKADLSDLRCRICSERFENLNTVAVHLKESHKKMVHVGSQLGVMPYILDKDKWNCAVCSKNLPSLLHLNKHTITHFLSYVCDICGKSYIASTGLLQHVRSKHENEYKAYCRRCQKAFPSMEAKAQHQRTQKRCMPHCCVECPERFPNWEMKQRHMVEVHGMTKKTYHCSDCDLICSDRRAFYDHFKMCHSQDCLVCMHCGLKFASTSRLNRHLGKHAV